MTELELRASEAWQQVVRAPNILDAITGQYPMLPSIALDYVQDVCGDRDDAVASLLDAAARWLEAKLPPGDLCHHDAVALIGDLRGECFVHANSALGTMWFRCEDVEQTYLAYPRGTTFTKAQFMEAGVWKHWLRAAETSLMHARLIVEAAYPETEKAA